ncbi:MAG: tetraacyldisaccharide 4'-kinase [Bacteroidaceae bacterium]|nr:tetraacyldisaccharide 4'-kinase [Bacteroidaceae bacterium]
MPGISILFRPFSWIYGGVVGFRNFLFDANVLRQRKFDVPIVAIGNLAVGGTGKTPHTEYLYRMLSRHGKIAVLSRGYGRKSKGFQWVNSGNEPLRCGDEPSQMKRKFPEAIVAVDADRGEGIEEILKKDSVAAILLDDAYQHRYVKPDVNILLTDYNRLYCDDHLMPEGRLREPMTSRRRADIIIVTKCPADLKPIDFQLLNKRTKPFASQHLFFTTSTYGAPYPLFESEAKPFTGGKILAVTGIAHPSPLVSHLKTGAQVELLRFPDHHRFETEDIKRIGEKFSGHDFIITTEKDAPKLMALEHEMPKTMRSSIYVQPIEVEFLHDDADNFKKVLENGLFGI